MHTDLDTAAISRARFLGLGAISGVTALGLLARPSTAPAAVPHPTGDDEGYLQVGLTGERILASFYSRAAHAPGFTAGERRRLAATGSLRRENVRRILMALAETPASDLAGLVVDIPRSALHTRGRVLRLGQELEGTLQGAYVRGLGGTADPATRILLARLLASCAQQLQALQSMAGMPSPSGLPGVGGLESAGRTFDRYLRTPASP